LLAAGTPVNNALGIRQFKASVVHTQAMCRYRLADLLA
jgi:hypothetical protein